MKRFLFIFGYETPDEHRSNHERGTDFESSYAVWIQATSEDEALSKGRSYAKDYVVKEYQGIASSLTPMWEPQNFAHWISANPAEEYSEQTLEALHEI